MLGCLWLVMTITTHHLHAVSGAPRSQLPRSCAARAVDNPCQNGGGCHVTLSAGDAAEPAVVTCRCPPAWTGTMCELERDPCADGSAVCGPGWSCVRNSSNMVAGYDCGCGARSGWRRLRDGLPRCVDVDECALLLPACYNGGRCHNRAGTFSCSCRPGFSGGRCQVGALPSRRSADGWHAWSRWSPCRSPCGGGPQRRSRTCGRRRAGCDGEPEQSRACTPTAVRCRAGPHQARWGDDHETEEDDGDEDPRQTNDERTGKHHRRETRERSEMEAKQGSSRRELGGVNAETGDAIADLTKEEWRRETRKANPLNQNWKLVHFLGFEAVRRRRSLAQIESYDDFEIPLMRSNVREARDLAKEEDNVNGMLQSMEIQGRYRRFAMQANNANLQPNPLVQKRSKHTTTNITAPVKTGVSPAPDRTDGQTAAPQERPAAATVNRSLPTAPPQTSEGEERAQMVTRPVLDSAAGNLTDSQKGSDPSSSDARPGPSLEGTLLRPSAAVRALVGPAVDRARAALSRLRQTEAARAAEQRRRLAEQEAGRRTARRQAAERSLWGLLRRTDAAAVQAKAARHGAQQQEERRAAAEARLTAERDRRRLLQQYEAGAAARHAAARDRLQQRLQEARRQAVSLGAALEAARRRAAAAEEAARAAEADRDQQRQQLALLEAAERQKLAELQRQGAVRLAAALREADREEHLAQEADSGWRQAAGRSRQPQTARDQTHGQVKTSLLVL